MQFCPRLWPISAEKGIPCCQIRFIPIQTFFFPGHHRESFFVMIFMFFELLPVDNQTVFQSQETFKIFFSYLQNYPVYLHSSRVKADQSAIMEHKSFHSMKMLLFLLVLVLTWYEQDNVIAGQGERKVLQINGHSFRTIFLLVLKDYTEKCDSNS